MDLSRTRRAIAEDVADLVDSRLGNVRFTLKNSLRLIFWHSYQAGKLPEKVMMKLDNLVDLAFNETRLCGPEDESYPCLDEAKLRPMLTELRALLNQEPDPYDAKR